MIAEGFYGAKCIHDMNSLFNIDMPIAETVYRILYEKLPPQNGIKKLIDFF
jgi:glycerol-3-phosphate dehydrogenase (NAD(P)+)